MYLFFSTFFFRYEYDDHYFLTDPKEFIYEFFPLQSEWQLLRNPITLAEFEELPFVRSLFFRYQLSFPSDNMKSVMHTDSTGKHTGSNSGQNARLRVPKCAPARVQMPARARVPKCHLNIFFS